MTVLSSVDVTIEVGGDEAETMQKDGTKATPTSDLLNVKFF